MSLALGLVQERRNIGHAFCFDFFFSNKDCWGHYAGIQWKEVLYNGPSSGLIFIPYYVRPAGSTKRSESLMLADMKVKQYPTINRILHAKLTSCTCWVFLISRLQLHIVVNSAGEKYASRPL